MVAFAAVALAPAAAGAQGADKAGKADSKADKAKSTKVVVFIEGKDAVQVRDVILQGLPPHADVVEDASFKEALAKAGQKGPLGNRIALSKQRVKLVEKLKKAGEAVGATVVIAGRVRRTKTGAQEVWVVYLDEGSEPVVDEAVPYPKAEDERIANFKSVLGPPLDKLAPPEEPPPPAPPPPVEKPKTDDEGPAREPNIVGRELVTVGLALEFAGRSFNYSEPVTENLLPYKVFGAPGLFLTAEFYPLAGSKTPFAKDAAVHFGFGRALGLQSAQGDGAPFGTTWQRILIGLKGRIRLGDDKAAPLLMPSGTLIFHNFTFDGAGELAPDVPSVRYTALRLGVDGRYPFLERFAVTGGLGYHLVFQGGNDASGGEPADVANRFRDTGIGGIDLGIGGAVQIIPGLEGRLGFEYVRYFYSFSPERGDRYVAGGATEEFTFIRVGAAYSY